MRLFKSTTVNWKYIIGEILLIFFGISLAIWFNNWNASNTINANKKIAIDKIEDEIRNNLDELYSTREVNLKIPRAIAAYEEIISNNDGQVVAGISEMLDFQETFPNFFIIKDSVQINDSLYGYLGNTRIRLELTAFSQIAWETSRNMGIANEFGYECLYNLENVYNIQQLVQNEMDKAAEALQNEEIDRLERILGFVSQLDVQLEDAYNSMLKNIGDCM
ncbi:MAG: hypothetical protein JSV59_09155 [Flavobacteriaceae bacterium]|nr:MAG: hypothetical protein JSV59_09155 [Flavobacteriaceae bacterium]